MRYIERERESWRNSLRRPFHQHISFVFNQFTLNATKTQWANGSEKNEKNLEGNKNPIFNMKEGRIGKHIYYYFNIPLSLNITFLKTPSVTIPYFWKGELHQRILYYEYSYVIYLKDRKCKTYTFYSLRISNRSMSAEFCSQQVLECVIKTYICVSDQLLILFIKQSSCKYLQFSM